MFFARVTRALEYIFIRSRCIPLRGVSCCIPLYPAVSHCIQPLYSAESPISPKISSTYLWTGYPMKNLLQSTDRVEELERDGRFEI